MIKWIIICVIGLIILGNLGYDIRKSVNSPVAQSNLEYAKEVTIFVWGKYLKEPAKFFWNEVFIKYIFTPTIDFIKNKMTGNKTSSVQQRTLFVYDIGGVV